MAKHFLGLLILILILSACTSSGPDPQLELSSAELRLNSTYPEASFTIRNVGDVGSVLEWSVTSDNPQVAASPSEGSLPNIGLDFFNVVVDDAGLAAGETLRATLRVSSNGGSDMLSVVYVNEEGPEPGGPSDYLCYPDAVETQAVTAQKVPQGTPNTAYVPGQLLVRYKEGTLKTLAHERVSQAVGREHGLRTLRTAPGFADLVVLSVEQDLEVALRALNADPRVAYAEPNYYLYTQATPNDTYLEEQWNLLDFGLPQAWDLETGVGSVTVAILDSGVDLEHEDLSGKLVQGCDFHDADNDPNPGSPKTTPDQTHGTHVAGIAAATGDNGVGVAGVAYTGVKVLPVKVFDDAGRVATVETVARAIRWAAGLNVSGVERNPTPAKIINLSLGGSGRNPNTGEIETIKTLDEAIRDAREAGALTVVASGNDQSENGAKGDEIFAPANAPDALAVGSVDSDYARSSFSMYDAGGRTVNLVAPGGFGSSSCGSVVSTVASAGSGNYGCQAGTSMAAPFVSGVAALLWSQHPDWTVDQIEQRLLSATFFDPGTMNTGEYGAGVLCADRALGAATLCGR